jgi:cell division protein ZapA (FtsZ GTPase activity inhibitor)
VKKAIEVSLLGQSFAVKSNREEGHVHAVASMVNRRIQDLKNTYPRKMSDQRAALLVALNLADDLIDLETEMAAFRGDLRNKTEEILGKVQTIMGQPDVKQEEEIVEKEHDVVLATVQK